MVNESAPLSRPITMEDVQRIIGAMTLEVELLRRENVALRATLTTLRATLNADGAPAPTPT